MKEEVLRMEHVAYQGEYELYSGSLSVLQGEVAGVVGLRNSGVSELFRILKGKYILQGGCIYLNERRMSPNAFKRPELLGIAAIHNSFMLNKELTVAENIILVNHLRRGVKVLRSRELNEQVDYLLHSLGIEIPVHVKGGELTLAEQHMILVARAVYEGSRIILLENIQQQYSQQEIDRLGWLLRRTARRGISYICKYYNDNYMLKYMDKLTFLRGGVTVGEYDQQYFADIGSVRDALGRFAKIKPEQPENVYRKEILCVTKLCTKHNMIPVSFSVCEGETVVLLDEKGKRESELIQVLSGREPGFYRSGKVSLEQKEVSVTEKKNRMKRGIAFLPENAAKTALLENMTIMDNVLLVKLAAGQWKFWCIRKRLSAFLADQFFSSFQRKSAIKYDVSIKVKELNEKERYDFLFYVNLKTNPRIFIMENPFAYNDEATRTLINRKIQELNKRGIGVLIGIHDMSDIPSIKCKLIKLPS